MEGEGSPAPQTANVVQLAFEAAAAAAQLKPVQNADVLDYLQQSPSSPEQESVQKAFALAAKDAALEPVQRAVNDAIFAVKADKGALDNPRPPRSMAEALWSQRKPYEVETLGMGPMMVSVIGPSTILEGRTLSAAEIAALSPAERALYEAMSEAERIVFAAMSPAERAAFARLDPAARAKVMRQRGVIPPPTGLSDEELAALPADQRALYEAMSPAERAAFASMSAEERAAFAAMSPAERAKRFREMGVIGPGLSPTRLAALPADQRALYETLSPAAQDAFAAMVQAKRRR